VPADTVISRSNARLSKRRAVMLCLVLLAGQHAQPALANDIPSVDDLAAAGSESRQQGIPTVVFVTREACPYCRTLRDEILLPMQRANKFGNRAVLVEVSLDRVEPLTGFDGQPTTAQAFGDRYQAQITPTLLFLDPQGREISKRIVGISNLELYGYYLQESIDTALQSIRSETPRN
jgi:thioredoxin-related protein